MVWEVISVKRNIFAGIIVLMAILMMGALSGCGEKGLDIAYEDLKEEFNGKDSNGSVTRVDYEKKSDTMTITLGRNPEDIEKLFEILNDDIEDAEIGNLVFTGLSKFSYNYGSGTTTYGSTPSTPGTTTPSTPSTPGTTTPSTPGSSQGSTPGSSQSSQSKGSSIANDSEAYKNSKNQSEPADVSRTISKGIGSLTCSKIKCLDISNVLSSFDLGKWTKVLGKTESLCIMQTDLAMFNRASKKLEKKLAKLKNLWLANGTSYYNLYGIGMFSGLEEVRFTAGLTKAQRKTSKEQGFTPDLSMSGKTREGVPLYRLTSLKKLERVLIFPELKDWIPNHNYYTALLALQDFVPEAKTNVIGEKDELVAFKDIDVPALAKKMIKKEKDQEAKDGKSSPSAAYYKSPFSNESKINNYIANTLETLLKYDAYKCYNAGKKYKAAKGKPKLKGKSLIYLAYPGTDKWSRKHNWNKEKFYDSSSNVLLGELKGKKVEVPSGSHDYDYFVYIYPRFTEYGRYDKGTVGYTQKTFVRVYDVKGKKRYKSVQIDTRPPARSFRYSGTPPEVHYENIRTKKVINYLEKL